MMCYDVLENSSRPTHKKHEGGRSLLLLPIITPRAHARARGYVIGRVRLYIIIYIIYIYISIDIRDYVGNFRYFLYNFRGQGVLRVAQSQSLSNSIVTS